MRLVVFGVLVAVATASGACNRNEPGASGEAPAAAAASSNAGTPVATSGVDAAVKPDAAPGSLGSLFSRAPEWREVTIPAGTALPVTLDTAIGSDISRVEEGVQAHVSSAVVVNGQAVIPAGSQVSGVVTDATQSGKVKGRAHVSVRFDSLTPQGPDVANERYTISTATVGRTAPATKEKDALEIGGPAAGGAIIGALVGGKKGAAIGTAVGGGAGTAVVLDTRGKEVRLARGAGLTLQLAEPLTVRVRPRG